MKPSDLALLRIPGLPTLSPDGRFAVVAVTRLDLDADDYRSELWQVATDGSAPARRITGGWRDSAPRYSPDGRWIAFLRVPERGRPAQPHVMPTGGGEPRRVGDHPLGAGAPVWSPDSRRIAYTARVPEPGRYGTAEGVTPDREPPRRITVLRYRWDGIGFIGDRRQHLFVVDPFADDPRPEQVTSGDHDHDGVGWSPDSELLTFVSARHESRDRDLTVDVWVCRPDGSEQRKVTSGGLEAALPAFTPDGATICFAAVDLGPDGCDFVGRNLGVWSVPLDGSAPPERLTDAERHHIAYVARQLETTGDGVLFTNENRGAIELLLVPYGGGPVRPVLTGRREVHGFASAGGVTIASVADATSAGELAVIRDGSAEPLTSFGEPLTSGAAPLPLEEVEASAPDGYPVHGWIVRPPGPGPHPVVLMIHGGPFTQYGYTVFDEAQVCARAGYAVVLGNPRGSSGYGQRHGRHVIGEVGARSAADLLALLDAALADPGLDRARVGVMGGSHGGFMTTWLAAHHGDRFRAAISERSVNAIDSFAGTSDIGWMFPVRLYGPAETWGAQSPHRHADRIEIPMLIIHSEQDWRCPLEQAQRLYVALKQRGVPTEMLLFPGEGHELSRSGLPSHRVARLEAVLDWWSRHLSAG